MSPDTKARIYAEAVQQFALRGYHGTSIRSISSALDIQVAGLYYYYPSKQEILLEIMSSFMDYLLAEVQASTAVASRAPEPSGLETPLRALRLAITTHIRCHADRQPEAFIADTELRSLTPENRALIVAKRDQYEAMFLEIIRDGIAQGFFRDADASITGKAIITMCTGVAAWFNSRGQRSIDDVAADYANLAVYGLVRSPDPGKE